jgi:hypothetical protein
MAMGSSVQHDDNLKSYGTLDDLIETRPDMKMIEVKDLRLNGLYFVALTAEEEDNLFDLDAALKGVLQYKSHMPFTRPRANAICNFLHKGSVALKMSFVQKQGFLRNEQVVIINDQDKPEIIEIGSYKFVDFEYGGSKTSNPVFFEKLTCLLNKQI